MAADEATMAAEAEEGMEEAINDKDKSSHPSIGGNNNDEGSNSVSDSDSGESPEAAPARRWRLQQGGGAVAGKFQ